MAVNLDSIAAKCRAWSKTPAGQARIKSVISEYSAEGRQVTYGGGVVATLAEMCKMADELVSGIKNAAASTGVSGSVMDAVSTLSYMVEDLGEGSYRFNLYFGGNLYRDSLAPEKYGGVENIIALFNNGYVAGSPVHGEWHGHYVSSKTIRPSLMFMQQAVDAFIGQYGGQYNMSVELNPVYSGGSWSVKAM